jgi:hypothetical protein
MSRSGRKGDMGFKQRLIEKVERARRIMMAVSGRAVRLGCERREEYRSISACVAESMKPGAKFLALSLLQHAPCC